MALVRPTEALDGTRLTDAGQETNGLLAPDGKPELPIEVTRAVVIGSK